MDGVSSIGMLSIIISGIVICVGTIAPAIGEAIAISKALSSIAQQPDEANTIIRTLFVGLAMIESLAIFCLVIAIVIIFTNPFWEFIIKQAAK